MKKKSRVAAILLTLVMVLTLALPGAKVSAAVDASEYQGTGNSNMKDVKMDGDRITGSFTVEGSVTDLSVYKGNQLASAPVPSAEKVGSTQPGGYWGQTVSFDITVSDGGTSTTGYTIIAYSPGTWDKPWAAAYIPAQVPPYKVGIQKDGVDVTTAQLGLYDGAVSGFSFVHEYGQSFEYSVDNRNIIDVNIVNGDNFTITPKAVGTATITAVVGGAAKASLTVTVTDNSSISAVWYETNQTINNNAVLNAEAGISYGIGVVTVPAGDFMVNLTNNTAGAAYVKSTDPAQYPLTLKAASEGSVKVTLTAGSKSVAFTVHFAPAQVYFDFYMDQACTEAAEPLVAVDAGKTVTVYTSLPVGSWDTSLAAGAQVVSQTKTSITIKGLEVDSISTITALDEDGAEMTFFDVYVTGEGSVDPDPEDGLYVTLTGNAAAASVGQLVKFTAKATGGTGDYTYRYVIAYDAKEEHIHAANTSTNCYFKMAKSGTKVVTVIVTDSNGDVATASYTVTVR